MIEIVVTKYTEHMELLLKGLIKKAAAKAYSQEDDTALYHVLKNVDSVYDGSLRETLDALGYTVEFEIPQPKFKLEDHVLKAILPSNPKIKIKKTIIEV